MFGLGEALFFLFSIKGLNLPFIGGRIKPFDLTRNLCANLGLELKTKEATSKKKAWDNVRSAIERGNRWVYNYTPIISSTLVTVGLYRWIAMLKSAVPSVCIRRNQYSM